MGKDLLTNDHIWITLHTVCLDCYKEVQMTVTLHVWVTFSLSLFFWTITGSFTVLNWKVWHSPDSQAQGIRYEHIRY